jgi:carbamoyl-phosphate synthase (ammonia)
LLTVDEIHDLTKIDTWFLERLQGIADFDVNLTSETLDSVTEPLMRRAKELGFSDIQIADRLNVTEDEVRNKRKALGIVPAVKQIDTLAAEYPAQTNYLYTTYNGTAQDDVPSLGVGNAASDGVMVLGSGAYRIGSSVEFDWCAVSCIRQLRKLGYRSIMVNYNPETVSTDYDECDQLYFEELSRERVMDINDRTDVRGVVVSVGGQIPNNLALPLHQAGVNVVGTSPIQIDSAEDRFKFSHLMDEAGVAQPKWKNLTTTRAALDFAEDVGYPVLIRPSYVLSGAAMAVVYTPDDLIACLGRAAEVSQEHPVVITQFLTECREVEFDAVAQDGEVICAAVSEHVENAGVHSGDATLILPPTELSSYFQERVRQCGAKVAKALNITGPFNAQFLAKGADVLIIECNLRASRSFPFVSKVMGADFIAAATKAMLGADYSQDNLPALFGPQRPTKYVGIKSPMFSFTRLGGADPLLGVEMASTGEVACFGFSKHEAFLKALIASNFRFEGKRNILLSIQAKYLAQFVHQAHTLETLGFNLHATSGTHAYLKDHGIDSVRLDFPSEAACELDVCTYLSEGKLDLVIALPNADSTMLASNYTIRRTAADFSIPLLTNFDLARLFVESMEIHSKQPFLGLEAGSLFDYYTQEPAEEAWTDPTEFH